MLALRAAYSKKRGEIMFMAMTNRWWSSGGGSSVRKTWMGQMLTRESSELKVEEEGEKVSLFLSGACRAEILLEKLPVVLKSLAFRTRLKIDASQTREWDSLALSALVVCLRNQARRLESVCLRGLPWWALGRLQFFGACHVLGPGWTGNYEQDCIRLERSEAEPASVNQ